MGVMAYGVSGAAAGVVAPVREGAALALGRSEGADLSVPSDTFLSGLHFRLRRRGAAVLLEDLGSRNGTFVDGRRVEQAMLTGAEIFEAGGCGFRLAAAADDDDDLRSILRCVRGPLFVILDAARDPRLYPMLCASGARYVSLYAGRSAGELEHVAPYLAEMTPEGTLMRTFVREGWGKAWGVLLTASGTMEEVWKQLRRWLMVMLDGSEKATYFRFYDPRVLRVFLAVADGTQSAEFGGPIRSWMMEDGDPGVMIHVSGWAGGSSMCRIRMRVDAGRLAVG